MEVHWLATCKASQSKIDEFLAIDGILSEEPCFRSARELFNMIETGFPGFGGPEWFPQDIALPEAPEEKLTLFLRNIPDCAEYLLSRPDLKGDVTFTPQMIFEADDSTAVINEMFTAHRWHQIQKLLVAQEKDAALCGILFGSDITHLTLYSGDIKVHALYMSVGNISKGVRNKTSRRTWMLIAYIPICKWEATLAKAEFRSKQHRVALPGILNQRLFHYSMSIICQPLQNPDVYEIIDPEGNTRLVSYVLKSHLADLEEQYKIAALDKSNCIPGQGTTEDFGSPEECEPRTGQSILEAITKVQEQRGINADPYDFSLGADKYRLGDVEYPFWSLLPFVDICKVLSLDLLHGFHKFFFDHPFQWNVNSLGEEEIDARTKLQPAYARARSFPRGVTHISQMSGKEHRALQTVHLSIVANSPARYSHELTIATRALMDYLYLAQLPTHTDKTLAAFQDAYARFHETKDIWIKNESRRGEKGNVIPHFKIPKLHNAHHLVEQVLAKGTTDNYSTEVIEYLHIDTLKEPFQATNRKDWQNQMIRWLVRRDKLEDFDLWLQYVEGRKVSDAESGNVCVDNTPIDQTNTCKFDHADGCKITDQQFGHWSTVQTDTEETRQRRGGFAMDPALAQGDDPTLTMTGAPLTPSPLANGSRKRKRDKTDNDREDRHSKRIIKSQDIHRLLGHQDIALKPAERLTMAELLNKYKLPKFLDDYKASGYHVASPMTKDTAIEIWKSI